MHQGYPIQIVKSNSQHKFELDVNALEDALLRDDIKDCNAVVVSVTGSFRKGKSFLLNFFLRYMNYMCKSNQAATNGSWLGDVNCPLDGFSWRGGSERTTTGILMWSEIFCFTLPNQDKVAVILLDTQGTFDCKSTIQDCATIFALSTMLSSIQVYNLFHNIQEDDLQHLQLFTKYGCLAIEETGNKPFQKLQFLVRDWSYPYEANYGSGGGRKILDKILEISDGMHPELATLRKHIKSCFTDMECFLMPHPGFKVSTNPDFDGRLSDMEDTFKICIEQFLPMLLSAENIIQKEIGGAKVKVKDLVRYFKCYMEVFNGDDIPQPKSILAATAEAGNQSAVAAAKETYHRLLSAACQATEPYLSVEELEQEHQRCKAEAMEKFMNKPKMGGNELSEQYRIQVEQDIDKDYNQYKVFNQNKVEVLNQTAFIEAKDIYFRRMIAIFGGSKSSIHSEKLQTEHLKSKNEALKMFETSSKMDGAGISTSYRIKLEQEIDKGYEQFKASNRSIASMGNQLAFVNAKASYHQLVAASMTANENVKPYFTRNQLEAMHVQYKDQVMEQFCEEYGDGESSEIYKSLLEGDIDKDYFHFKTTNESNAQSCNQLALVAAKQTYRQLMTAFCQSPGHRKPYAKWDMLQREHLKYKEYALNKFKERINMEGDELYESYSIKLTQDIDDNYQTFRSSNQVTYQAYTTEKKLKKKQQEQLWSVVICILVVIVVFVIASGVKKYR